jgi:hypothetical protein
MNTSTAQHKSQFRRFQPHHVSPAGIRISDLQCSKARSADRDKFYRSPGWPSIRLTCRAAWRSRRWLLQTTSWSSFGGETPNSTRPAGIRPSRGRAPVRRPKGPQQPGPFGNPGRPAAALAPKSSRPVSELVPIRDRDSNSTDHWSGTPLSAADGRKPRAER